MEQKDLLVKAFKAGWKAKRENASFNGLMLEDKYANEFADELVKICNIPRVSVSFRREQLAKDILVALLQNPERYKYIAEKVESGELKQEEANLKNINKAYKIADSFLSAGANER